jgi:excinuclease ABC subunit A
LKKEEARFIELRGVKMHNLKNVDVRFKRNTFTVVTGVSGSGKSSLVFDTLYAEGQRRYVESLSSYARQFLGRLDKPEVDYIKGLTPCVAIEQKVNSRNPRSTVATSTEIYDYLKLLFTRVGRTYSPVSGDEVKCHTVEDVVDYILSSTSSGDLIYFLTELPMESGKDLKEVLELELKKGYSRLLYKNEVVKIDSFNLKRVKSDDVFLLIDRLVAEDEPDSEFMQRLNDSIQTAFYEGHGLVTIQLSSLDNQIINKEFSNLFELDGISFEKPTINFLSFNNPYGACKTCQGFGSVIGIDKDLVIPNKSLSLFEGAVGPWRGETLGEWKNNFIQVSDVSGFPIHKSYESLTVKELDLLWNGNSNVRGINDFFKFLQENSYKIQYRVMMARYRGKTTCPDCYGTRLRKDAGYVKLTSSKVLPFHSKGDVHKINMAEVLLLTIKEAVELFDTIDLPNEEMKIADRLLIEIKSRLGFLNDVGLSYLGLNRLSNSLSGGESQRINLATSLGSSLVGSTYVLDEPSIGLHSKDTEKLITVIKKLRDTGNTVIVVEHDEEIMYASDELLDIGPKAGVLGGEVVFQGDFKDLASSKTLTADYLNHIKTIEIPERRRKWNNYIEVKQASLHNLKKVNVKIPLNVFTVVSGISGSGKTSLIKGVLYPHLQRSLDQFSGSGNLSNDAIGGDLRMVNAVEMVDQNPIGKSSRSNPVTYIKAYDAIRDLFSDQVISKQRGYKSSTFSFNVDGGRCDNCKGEGEELIEMQFMADLHLPCEVCKGKRFKTEVLEVTYSGKNISDVLKMTVDEAMDFFEANNVIKRRLRPLQDVGLGYVSLGQSSNTLSGGEAQRIKLASFLAKSSQSNHTLFIFDEPTTGLHFHDVQKLLKSFNALVDKGNTIITIEHNLDVIKMADWVLDMGPEGGQLGGEIVFEGVPEDLINSTSSTGRFLKSKMEGKLINPALNGNKAE